MLTTNPWKMSRYTLLLTIFCLCCGQPSAPDSNTSSDQETVAPMEAVTPEAEVLPTTSDSGPLVYVTPEGDKYHTADCRFSTTATSVTLAQAKGDGKTACGVCKPNSKTGEKQARCSGITAEGKRCQRMTADASGKCFQHRDG